MDTIRRRKPRPAYALYAIAIGGGSILICLAILSIALKATEKKTGVAEEKPQPQEKIVWPWQKQNDDKRRELLEARWLLHKSTSHISTKIEWLEPLGRFFKLESRCKSISTSELLDSSSKRIEELHAKFDGMMVRIQAKYGDTSLVNIDSELAARIAEGEPELKSRIRRAVRPFANEAESRAYKACSDGSASEAQIQADLQHYYDLSLKAALAAAKEHFIEITGMKPKDEN